MFRKKDIGPSRPTGPAEKTEPMSSRPMEPARSPSSPPEVPRRAIDLPTLGQMPGSQSGGQPGGQAPGQGSQAGPERLPAPDRGAEGKRLIVGQGISLSGEITSCDRLVVQGNVQVTINDTRAIEIAETGRFTNGRAEVEDAEISGVYEGELTVRRRLHIRSTGRVRGTIRYGDLEIERGGRLSGSISRLDEEQQPEHYES